MIISMADILKKSTADELRRSHGVAKTLPALNPVVMPITKAKIRRLADTQGVAAGVMLDRLFAEMEVDGNGVPSGIPNGWADKYTEEKMELENIDP